MLMSTRECQKATSYWTNEKFVKLENVINISTIPKYLPLI